MIPKGENEGLSNHCPYYRDWPVKGDKKLHSNSNKTNHHVYYGPSN